MPTLIHQPTLIHAAGNKPKEIREFAGRVNSGHADVSIARMVSPEGWIEPGQRPEFEEITIVLRGVVRVGCFVSSDAGFTAQPQIANGASDLLLEIFGDNGKHARAAVGVNTLPLDASVEVEFVFEIE